MMYTHSIKSKLSRMLKLLSRVVKSRKHFSSSWVVVRFDSFAS
jgi:hypothetical protein